MKDPNLDVKLDASVVELGTALTGRVQRWPSDGDDNSKKIGKVKAVRIKVSWRTEGRGDRARETVGEVTIPASEFGQANGAFAIPIPPNAPISYDGSLIRVIWQVEARTDRKMTRDPKNRLPLLVVPRNGRGRYRRAHPLPRPAEYPIGSSPQSDDQTRLPDGPFIDQQVGGDNNQPDDSGAEGPFIDRPDYLEDFNDD